MTVAATRLPCIERLRELLAYDPDTGSITWAVTKGQSRHGHPALSSLSEKGYRYGMVLGRNQRAHRVAWALYYGDWPKVQIDHINGDPSDNRIENLRSVAALDNARNRKRPCTNRTGVIGVVRKPTGRWYAQIKVRGRKVHIGTYGCMSAAAIRRWAVERRLGFHENHGREPS